MTRQFTTKCEPIDPADSRPNRYRSVTRGADATTGPASVDNHWHGRRIRGYHGARPLERDHRAFGEITPAPPEERHRARFHP